MSAPEWGSPMTMSLSEWLKAYLLSHSYIYLAFAEELS